MRKTFLIVLAWIALLLAQPVLADNSPASNEVKAPTVWKASFYGVIPNNENVTQAYCESHSPDVFETTIANILKTGAMANNGVLVKYNNYHQTSRKDLFFIEVNAVMSGNTDGKPWHSTIYIHEQKLTKDGTTYAVWSDDNCKGFFTGEALK